MSCDEYLEARTMLVRGQVKLIHATDFLFLFHITIGGKEVIEVSHTDRGWICDAIESREDYVLRCSIADELGKPRPIRWGCSLDKREKNCTHIRACKLYLEMMHQNNLNSSITLHDSDASQEYSRWRVE